LPSSTKDKRLTKDCQGWLLCWKIIIMISFQLMNVVVVTDLVTYYVLALLGAGK
jgi:hypothetical protein